MSMIDDIDTSTSGKARIKVMGLGGGGGNAVNEMIRSEVVGVQFICANTDLQVLSENMAPIKIQLGEKLTRGLGAGGNPENGKNAAAESINALREAMGDADMVFITAGMGGGTGTGSAPIVAEAAREAGILTVGVVTKPFSFEGSKRMKVALNGIEELKKYVDSLIVIPNDRLLDTAAKNMPFKACLQLANEVLNNAVRGISDVIMRSGMFNLDFADVKSTMGERGLALMGTGRASGDNRARDAVRQAIMSPLLDDVSIDSAKAILYNITASEDILASEISEIGLTIREAASEDIDIKFGVVTDDSLGDEIQVTVIATGIEPKTPVSEETNSKVIDFSRSRKPEPQDDDPRKRRGYESEDDFVRPRRATGANESWGDEDRPLIRSRHKTRMTKHTPGADGLTFDPEDSDIPAFLRAQPN